MKKIVFYHGGDVMKKDVPVSSKTQDSYEHFFQRGKERGFEMSWSSYKYFKDDRFTHRVIFDGKKWKKIRNKPVTPDFIYDKSKFRFETIETKEQMASIAPYLNPISLLILTSDKMLTYLSFPDVVTPTYRVARKKHVEIALKKIKSRKVVMKPSRGSGGEGVRVVERKKVKRMKIDEPYVMQPFLDSSRGIPGVYKGVHDLRLLFLGNKLFHAYVRTAAPGTVLCNVSQGGQQFGIPLKLIPNDVKKKAKVFQKAFGGFRNTFYSVDFVYGKKGPQVIELNSMPGLADVPGYTPYLHRVHEKLLDHIKKFV